MRQTSHRRVQHGHASHVGAGRYGSRPVKAAAEPKPGQVLCPVCRNGVTPTTTGYLRQHRDLFGNTCYNRRPPSAEPTAST